MVAVGTLEPALVLWRPAQIFLEPGRSSDVQRALRMRILLVDDDSVVLETFGPALSLEGYDVCSARDAATGLQLAVQTEPDAVILDLRMPIQDGLGFLRRLRDVAKLEGVPVAIVTGDYMVDDETVTELEALGAQVLFKPLWLEDLLDLARTLCDRAERCPAVPPDPGSHE